MKKYFKWLRKDGRVYLLRRTVCLFGEQWECFGDFEDSGENSLRCQQITKLLNECIRQTENNREND